MNNNTKLLRINQSIKSEVSRQISSYLPGDVVSVLCVDTNPDLSLSRIYISSLGDTKNIVDELNSYRSKIWVSVSKRLKIRKLPKFKFIYNKTYNEISILGIPVDV
jgi:ribosome-binding factor A